MRALEALGRRVDRAWDRAGRARSAFPDVAAEALAAAGATVDVPAVVRALYAGGRLPTQRALDEAFGEPPLTVYRQADFFIELLFWHTGTTGVHEHRFSGAFMVAEGSSLETRYRFTETTAYGRGFALGQLELVAADVLARGTVRPIHPGRRLIHSVFHLGAPSATLVVRTPARRGVEREYRYPHVALDPAARTPRTTKQLQLLDLCARTGWGDYVAAVCTGIAHADVLDSFHLVSRARLHLDGRRFAPVAAALRKRHRAVAEPLLRVADEERRKRRLVLLRGDVPAADLRFFLGLLVAVPDRARIVAALAQRFTGEDPEACLALLRRTITPVLGGGAAEVFRPLDRGGRP